MRKMNGIMILALVLLALTASQVLLLRARASKPEAHLVRLKDGAELSGLLLELQPARYLLQDAERCLVLKQDEIRSVDGEDLPGVPALEEAGGRKGVLSMEAFDRVHADGSLQTHYTIRNGSPVKRVLTGTSWGLAPHEFEFLGSYRVVDRFGQELPLEVTRESEQGPGRITARFPRPVLPGEPLELIAGYRLEDYVIRDDGELVYRHAGDYPENRLVTRSVLLPMNAEVLKVSPEPLYHLETEQGPLVVWRHYFAKGERLPWEVRYRL